MQHQITRKILFLSQIEKREVKFIRSVANILERYDMAQTVKDAGSWDSWVGDESYMRRDEIYSLYVVW